MTAARIPELQRSIDGMAVPGIFVDHRVIAHGDEFSLLPDELDAFATSVEKVRRASGAARIVALAGTFMQKGVCWDAPTAKTKNYAGAARPPAQPPGAENHAPNGVPAVS